MIDLQEIVKKVQAVHKDFHDFEIIELCEEYLSKIPKKTKEESKRKSLNKFIEKEFELSMPKDIEESSQVIKQRSLDEMPISFLEGKAMNVDYLINVWWLTKDIVKTELFKDVNLKIRPDDKVALIGRNGAGKTTLLKMILGIEEMDDGTMIKAKDLKIGYLSQDLFWESREHSLKEEMLGVFPSITVDIHRLAEIKLFLEENHEDSVFLLEEKEEIVDRQRFQDGFRKYDSQLEILKYFWFSESDYDKKIKDFSGWEQTKIQIARFLIQEVDLLILDEPTNHLDIEWIMFLEHFCKIWKKALICISHDRRFIDNVFNKIMEISNKKINTYNGNYDSYLTQKQAKYEIDLKDYKNQQKYFEQQNKFIERFRYKASKAAMVQSRIKMLDKIVKLDAPENDLQVKDINLKVDIRLPNLVMRITWMEVGYNEPLVVLPKMIEVNKNNKIGIIWKNGVGKTTLLKTILKEIPSLKWESYINENIRIGSYSQVLEELDHDSNIIEELAIGVISQKEVRNILGWLLIGPDKVDQKIWTLSGGEKAKVALCKMLLSNPHFIIMDEPTNHLDLYSKEVVKNMLNSFPGNTLIVSHDRDILESMVDQIWVIKDGDLNVFDVVDQWFSQIF